MSPVMDAGDLVEYQGKPHKVLSLDQDVKTATLQDWSGQTTEVADDDPELKNAVVLSKWPFVTAPSVSMKAKRPTKLTRTVQGHIVELVPFKEWSPTDILRLGGPIFLSPKLRLIPGEVLVLHYEGGSMSRLTINRGFGSVSQRRNRQNKRKIPKVKTAFDYINEED